MIVDDSDRVREAAPYLMRALCACVDALWLRAMANAISSAEADALRLGGAAILAVRIGPNKVTGWPAETTQKQ